MKVFFQALGCRLNEAELEGWSNEIIRKGHQLSASEVDADVIVFNTCSVTGEADRKSRKLINRIHQANPDSRLVVTGCYASLQADRVRQQLGVDLVVPNQQKDNLVDTLLVHFAADCAPVGNPDDHALFDRGRQRAFIKIQDGCRYRCTFCIVTVARGEERSRSRQQILNDIRRYHQQGVQEIVITGVHVGGYGSDRGDTLYELITEILDKTAIPRIRLASVEPWDLPDNFFTLFADNRLMPHMHLPLQSGSDSVLRRMARRCKTREFSQLVDKAHSTISDFNITTDIIAGFPGESDAEWRETMAFVEKMGFGDVHIFTYSQRAGTKAAKMPDQVDSGIKKARSAEMHELARYMKTAALSRRVGEHCDVLWEHSKKDSDHVWFGYTPQYHRITCERGKGAVSGISAVNLTGITPGGDMLVGSTR